MHAIIGRLKKRKNRIGTLDAARRSSGCTLKSPTILFGFSFASYNL
jgi:hypothetical protein